MDLKTKLNKIYTDGRNNAADAAYRSVEQAADEIISFLNKAAAEGLTEVSISTVLDRVKLSRYGVFRTAIKRWANENGIPVVFIADDEVLKWASSAGTL